MGRKGVSVRVQGAGDLGYTLAADRISAFEGSCSFIGSSRISSNTSSAVFEPFLRSKL